MTVALVLFLVITAVIGLAVVGIAAIARHQKHAIADTNEIIPGEPTRAPLSWAGLHDPEARLHRRLRDAMTALRAVDSLENGTTIFLRSSLRQSALNLDDHLVAVSLLAADHKTKQLQTITTAVQCIEAGVAQYAAAAARPDTTALEADLAAVQHQLDTAADLQNTLWA